jgi:hypothetical protein
MRNSGQNGADLFVPRPAAIDEITNVANLLNEVRTRLAELRLAPSATEQEFRDALDIAWVSALRLTAEMNKGSNIGRRQIRASESD